MSSIIHFLMELLVMMILLFGIFFVVLVVSMFLVYGVKSFLETHHEKAKPKKDPDWTWARAGEPNIEDPRSEALIQKEQDAADHEIIDRATEYRNGLE